jgi:hypothetical protein
MYQDKARPLSPHITVPPCIPMSCLAFACFVAYRNVALLAECVIQPHPLDALLHYRHRLRQDLQQK